MNIKSQKNQTIESEITPKMIEKALGKGNRDYDILMMRLSGKKLQEIADVYGVTRERIRQIETKLILKVEMLSQHG